MRGISAVVKDEHVVRMYREGVSLKRIALILECGRQKVRDILVANGIEIRSLGGLPKDFSKEDRQYFISWFKNGFGCTDCKAICGEFWGTESFEFDHLPEFEKLFEVNAASATKINASRDMILDEIAKCELVCCNCHRKRSRLRRIQQGADSRK